MRLTETRYFSSAVGRTTPTGKASSPLQQVFVRVGERRGDLRAVVSGLEAGQTIVSTGAFKLQNGSAIVVNNALAPKVSENPTPDDR